MTPRSLVRTLEPLLIIVPAMALAACSPAASPREPRPPSAVVLVENRGWSDVVVYLADGNAPLRLGRVGALERTRLAVPGYAATTGVRLIVRSAAGQHTFAGEVLVAGPGGVLVLTIQPLLEHSTLSLLSYGPPGP